MSTKKDLGNEQFKAKNYEKAVEFYTEALEEATDHTVLGNRSMAYLNLGKYELALSDADECIKIKPDWGKGYHRKGTALHKMRKFEDSMEVYAKGLEIDPTNTAMKNGMEEMRRDFQASQNPGAGPQDLFTSPEAEAKLKADPKTAKHFADPQFASLWGMIKQNPAMMMQMFQSDPRLMDCFQVLTGINLMDIQEQELKKKDQDEDMKRKQKEEAAKKQAEEEARKKAEAEAALPESEKKRLQDKKDAEATKARGNELYKARKFEEALAVYQEAIDAYPSEPLFYSNKAACHFEMKNFEKCMEACDEGIAQSKGENYDYAKTGKLMARKANALLQMKKFDESIEMYQKALLENNDHTIKMGLTKAKKSKLEAEAAAYIDPEKAEEHRLKGNDLYKEGKYPDALKEYDEGVKRDPNSVAIYSNRCATWIKLLGFVEAMKDADKCLELDPKFVKAYARKGTCHHMMKEYHKAIKAFDDGLKIDPSSKECNEGKQKTIMTIQMQASTSSGNDEERLRHAMADPEIQKIMSDPIIRQVLQDLQADPKSCIEKLQDPYIADAINKLVAAGVVKMG